MLGITTTNARVGGFRGLGKIAKLILAYFARVIAASGVTEGKVCLSNSLSSLDSKQLLDNASLVLIPSGYKESVLFSQVPTSGLGDLDVVRATTATRVNSDGLIELVPRNLLQYSNILTNAVWTKTNVSVTSGQVSPTQPNNEGWLLNKTATGVDGLVYNAFNLNSLTTHSYSYYILKDNNETRFPEFFLRLNTGQVEQYVQVNTKTGAFSVRVASAGCTQSITSTADNLWWRLILTNPAPTAFTADNRHGVRPAAATVFGVYNLNATGSVITYGAQVEEGTTATEYLPTVTRLNFPRLDYTNSSCPSLLVEPQRTNVATYSNDLSNAIWTKTGAVITPNTTISPDGNQNAATLTFSAANQLIAQSCLTLSTNVTGSFYLKGTNGQTIAISVGGIDVLVTLTSNWQRFTLNRAVTTTTFINVNTFSGATARVLQIYGLQAEVGSYATSYIPTVAASVTRNADRIEKTGISSLIGQTQGTLYAEVIIKNLENQICASIQRDGNFNSIYISQQNNKPTYSVRANNTSIFSYSNGVFLNGINKVALVYNTNGTVSAFLNGVKVSTVSTSSFVFSNTLSTLQLFDDGYYSSDNTSIKNSIILFKTALTDAECIALTTL